MSGVSNICITSVHPTDVKRALVGVGLITQERGTYMLDKDFNNMSKFLNRSVPGHVSRWGPDGAWLPA